TGAEPAKHGVVGNNYFNRAESRKVTLIQDPEFDKEQIVKSPTLYDVAHDAGMKTAAIRWPATRNAKTLDWAVPDVGDADLLMKYSTPILLTEFKDANIPIPGKMDFGSKNAPRDEAYTDMFDLILKKH